MYVRLCTVIYTVLTKVRDKKVSWKDIGKYLFYLNKKKAYVYINGAPTKYFRLLGKIVYTKNSRVLRMGASKVNVDTFYY
jgi:hypothetical protein